MSRSRRPLFTFATADDETGASSDALHLPDACCQQKFSSFSRYHGEMEIKRKSSDSHRIIILKAFKENSIFVDAFSIAKCHRFPSSSRPECQLFVKRKRIKEFYAPHSRVK